MEENYPHDKRLDTFFTDAVPGYILGADETTLWVRITDVFECDEVIGITEADVALYEEDYADSWESIRFLCGIAGDHRMMDNLQDMAKNWFAWCKQEAVVDGK